MKKFVPIFVVIIFSLIGCDFQLPKSVSIKTKADYNFTIAKFEKDLSEFFSAGKIAESLEGDPESDTMEIIVHDYWPEKEGDVQKFLLNIPIKSISLDMTSNFEKMKISESASNMSFEQEIKVPDIKEIDVEKSIPLSNYGILEDETGIPINPAIPIDVDEITFKTFSSDDSFEECIIEEGELSLELVTDGWEGTTVTWEEITLTGGLTLPKEKFVTNGNKCVASLKDAELKNADTVANIKIKLSATNANTTNNPVIKGKCTISKIKSVKVRLPEGTETTIHADEPFPADETIKKIVLADSKFLCNYYNTMPSGNDFDLSCGSDFLGIVSAQSRKLNAGTPEDTKEKIIISADNGESGKTIVRDAEGKFPDIDFNAGFNFGTDDGFLIAKNVEPGETYKIGVDVKIEFEWISMDINMRSFSSEMDEVITTNMNLSSIFKGIEESLSGTGDARDFFSSIRLKSIPLFVYCQTPDIAIFKNRAFSGDIILGTSTADNEFVEYLKNGAPTSLFNGKSIEKISLPVLESDSATILTNLEKYPYSGKVDLADLLNSSTDGTLAMKAVNLGLRDTGDDSTDEDIVTITKEELYSSEDLNKSCDIEMQAFIVIALDFIVGDDTDSNNKVYYIAGLFDFGIDANGENGDIFGREKALEDETLYSYLDVIKSARMGLSSTIFPFKCSPKSPGIYINMGIPGIDEKVINFSNDVYFSISGEEVEKMLSTYPLKPKVRVGFPKGNVSIGRSTPFEAVINVGLTTDGTIPLSALAGGN